MFVIAQFRGTDRVTWTEVVHVNIATLPLCGCRNSYNIWRLL